MNLIKRITINNNLPLGKLESIYAYLNLPKILLYIVHAYSYCTQMLAKLLTNTNTFIRISIHFYIIPNENRFTYLYFRMSGRLMTQTNVVST
jgi:hypothetical protein